MNLTIVLLGILVFYKLVVRSGPFNLLELKFIPFSAYDSPHNSRSFNLVDLVSKIQNGDWRANKERQTEELTTLNFELEVDRPDLLFFDHFTNHMYLGLVKEELNRTSKVQVKAVLIYQDDQQKEKKLELHDCLDLTFDGQVTGLEYESGRLIIQHSELEEDGRIKGQAAAIVQSITCNLGSTLHTKARYLFRDDMALLKANFTHLLGRGNVLESPVLVRENLIGLDKEGQLLAINLVTQKVSAIELTFDGCKGISKVASLGLNLILVCYQPTGLSIKTSLVIARIMPVHQTPQGWQGGRLVLSEVDRHSLKSKALWRSMHDYLTFLDIVKIGTSPSQNTAVVTLKTEAVWFFEDKANEKGVKIEVRQMPVEFNDLVMLHSDYQAFFVSSFGGRDTMITSQRVDSSDKKKFSEQVLKFPRRFYKQVAVGSSVNSADPYVVVLDDTGLTVYQQVVDRPHHSSFWHLLDLIIKVSIVSWQIFMYGLVCRAGAGILCQARSYFMGTFKAPEPEEDPEKTGHEYLVKLGERVNDLCSQSYFDLLKPTSEPQAPEPEIQPIQQSEEPALEPILQTDGPSDLQEDDTPVQST
jgi:hypothetical protein